MTFPGQPPSDLPEDAEESYIDSSHSLPINVVTRAVDQPQALWTDGFSKTTPYPAPPHLRSGGKRIGASFLLMEKIAEGGNGEIWRTLQKSLSRPVAVKKLRENMAPPPGYSEKNYRKWMDICFRQEAITAAGLEHPNIIPVYDLGEDDQGKPLMAMKLLRGTPWHNVLRDDFPSMNAYDFLAKHLPNLVSVAQAVAFAHSHGIVHRDLKPHQVMIGRFGEVVLMDWGLAMAYDPKGRSEFRSRVESERDSPLFNPANPAGTPCYMAPEQTEKDSSRLGPWTDLFLLGGILYHLLTGRPPHSSSSGRDSFEFAQECEIIPPEERSPNRAIPPPLSRIAMQALAKEPKDRLPDAETFIEELQNYLTGSDKRRESLQISHSVANATASGEDYTMLAENLKQLERALVLWPGNEQAIDLQQEELFRYAEAAISSRDLKLARLQAERLDHSPRRDQLLRRIAELEEEQRLQDERLQEAYRQAQRGQQKAIEMRQRAERMVQFLIQDLDESLRSIGRLDLLLKVANECLEYFDSLPEEEENEETIGNRAKAYINIGDVLHGQGKFSAALDSYRRARELAKELLPRATRQSEWLRILGQSHDRAGEVYFNQGEAEEALRAHEAALKVYERLHRDSPDDALAAFDEARALQHLGVALWRKQELEKSREIQEDALARLESLYEADPGNMEILGAISYSKSWIANILRDIGDLGGAITITREGLEIRERLVELEPRNVWRIHDQLWTSGNLALLYLADGQMEEAHSMLKDDIPIRLKLSEEDPNNLNRLNFCIFPLSLISEIEFVTGCIEEALATCWQGLEIAERTYRLDPSAYAAASCSIFLCRLGEVLFVTGERAQAKERGTRSLELAETNLAKDPDNWLYVKLVVRAQILIGAVLYEEGEQEGAGKVWKLAAEKMQRFDANTSDPFDFLLAASAWLAIGDLESARPIVDRLWRKNWKSPIIQWLCQIRGIETEGFKN